MSNLSRRPQIHMIDDEADALADLALSNQNHHPVTTALLLKEILRARIYPAHRIPSDVVAMGSFVEFVDEARGTSRTVQLVYPRDADTGADRISILTPLGAGLIGMRTGNSILWPDRKGSKRSLMIVKVKQMPGSEANAAQLASNA